MGLTDDGTANSSDKLTDTAGDVRKWLFADECCDEVTDMTEWPLSLPNGGSIIDVDEGDSTFVRNSKGTKNNAELSLGISTKQVELSL